MTVHKSGGMKIWTVLLVSLTLMLMIPFFGLAQSAGAQVSAPSEEERSWHYPFTESQAYACAGGAATGAFLSPFGAPLGCAAGILAATPTGG